MVTLESFLGYASRFEINLFQMLCPVQEDHNVWGTCIGIKRSFLTGILINETLI